MKTYVYKFCKIFALERLWNDFGNNKCLLSCGKFL